MSAWDEAAVIEALFPAADAARTAHLIADPNDQMGALGAALGAALAALAPHLAARDAEVRRQACEAMREEVAQAIEDVAVALSTNNLEPTDVAYNMALEHAAAAVRTLPIPLQPDGGWK